MSVANDSNTFQENSSIGEKRKAPMDEDSITMLDVLREEESLEVDAKAVLGNADDSNCSYHSGGYMKRQALYACLTCSDPRSPNFQPAALCLGCSFHCHPNHEIVELYTKRHVRCDCGNDKFQNNPCKLADDKTALNDQNNYNQNYSGVYCVCHRPYPDPENETPDEMLQCVVCEDWYHSRHIEGISSLPKDVSYSEMICHVCVELHKDLFAAYVDLGVSTVGKGSDEDINDASVVDDSLNKTSENGENNTDEKLEGNSILDKTEDSGSNSCPRKLITGDISSHKFSALFLPTGWRDQLCRCDDCTRIYEEKHLEFLLDSEDTVHFYESQSCSEEGTQYEEGMKALSSMDRVQQMEAIQSYNEMKESLMIFLKKFAEEGKVVTQEDIGEFFKTFNSAKRRRVEIPKFCR